ncbi:helix-turn-helix transcriptional regulator [Pseudoalteromonas sp. McH1-7]|uniref:HTH cro/C1-type domain-containing protein n=1 Tax=Pseudoalteromonas peptidolytica F12-50-A1 TaxID=1315280 RepID=A0A8I0MVK4_9GAMM|nr:MULTISPECIES: helix-turn-helix transcriptional regulator [Pseudoalteromonas]MBE0346674.1 hypothetical protein [Pseudoalteromonas peptidolytica F12-50-A1]MDW7549857.1 helix-turn-helix transcriptional regulator [Pseudoalteromonas peptidolytica]NLR13590.1 helix-turn-helix transcriptional regulator [Pseudoalteromonas peptidolytica]NUZ09397.1 helix-turn-helix transcriptional regulator [Pseudoalteromonas sp. McH1-7]USD29808.1 helix-turn-helix transcriptional regulator [Pseudoalteromonas sp. SCSIO
MSDGLSFDYIGKLIRSYRSAECTSLQALADRSGVSRSMIAQIESGQTVPTIAVLAKLAEAMNYELATLVQPPGRALNISTSRATKDNIISKVDSPFTCHILKKQSGLFTTEIYQFYFNEAGKTSFSANVRGSIKHLWLQQGKLDIYVAGNKISAQQNCLTTFNANIPHRLESRSEPLAKGLFFVVY